MWKHVAGKMKKLKIRLNTLKKKIIKVFIDKEILENIKRENTWTRKHFNVRKFINVYYWKIIKRENFKSMKIDIRGMTLIVWGNKESDEEVEKT